MMKLDSRIHCPLHCTFRCFKRRSFLPQTQRYIARTFSSSPLHHTENRDKLWQWLNGPGQVFKRARPGSTNYLGAYDKQGNLIRERRQVEQAESAEDDGAVEDGSADAEDTTPSDGGRGKKRNKNPPETQEDLRPFPLNPYFRSQPVLSDELRDEIYKRVTKQGQTVREVSMALHVDMRRVGAVVRMKTIEEEWTNNAKPLANNYANAIMGMLPQTPLASTDGPESRQPRHESINDLPVHWRTLTQVFHPVSESKRFTRTDAAKVFDRTLKPADERIPHPQMITDARAKKEGTMKLGDRMAVLKAGFEKEVETRRIAVAKKEAIEKARTTVVVRGGEQEGSKGQGLEFRFRDFNAERVGRNERSRRGVGWRYGIPHEDRKKNQVKMPTTA